MNDLISRQAAIDDFYKYPNMTWTTLDVLEHINALPSTQPERKKGRWRKGVCECGYDWAKDAPISSVPNFCPNCGADMREVNANETD